jgi:Domain of unknown function (DUF4342)
VVRIRIKAFAGAEGVVIDSNSLYQVTKKMEERTFWESIKAEGTEVLGRVKQVIHEGNVRRVVIKQEERVVAEFPLTVGVVGAVVAPVLAAIGVLVALLTDCSIELERIETDGKGAAKTGPEGTTPTGTDPPV